jgi:hypothetical protein
MGPPWQDKVQQQGESPSSMWSCERGGSERTMGCDSLGSLEVEFFYFILFFLIFQKYMTGFKFCKLYYSPCVTTFTGAGTVVPANVVWYDGRVQFVFKKS